MARKRPYPIRVSGATLRLINTHSEGRSRAERLERLVQQAVRDRREIEKVNENLDTLEKELERTRERQSKFMHQYDSVCKSQTAWALFATIATIVALFAVIGLFI